MNSAMLQVATQICIGNYPKKHTGSFLYLSTSFLLPSLSFLFPISFVSLRPLSFSFYCLYLWTPPSPPPCLSLTLTLSQRLLKWCLVGQLRWAEVWACVCVRVFLCILCTSSHMHEDIYACIKHLAQSCLCPHCLCIRMCVCVCMVSSLCVWVGAYSCAYKCPLRPNTAKLSLETGQ